MKKEQAKAYDDIQKSYIQKQDKMLNEHKNNYIQN